MRRTLLAGLLVVCAAVTGSAARPWRSIRGPNVIVYGQQSAGRLREVALEIEQFRLVVGDLIRGARQPLPLPTIVFAFEDAADLRPYVPLYRGKPIGLAGFCHCGGSDDLSVIAASLQRRDETSSVVFHEYAHLLLRNAARGLPLWLNEGLAEYFSTFMLKSNGREAVVGRPLVAHILQLNRQPLLPVAQLVAVDAKSPMYNEGERRSIFYAESWALAHYLLLERPGGQDAINRYLAAATKGEATPEALAEAAGLTLKELDAELARYVRHPAFSQMTLKLKDKVDVDEPDAARSVPDAEAEARLGDLLMRVGRMEEAQGRLEAAATSGAGNATVQLTLGLLRMRTGRDLESVAALKKAAALAPGDFVTQYLFALTMLRRALDLDAAPARETTEQAYDALTRALTTNAESAAALAWHAYADMELDVRWDEAREETVRAIALAPGREDFRLQLALIYLHNTETAADGRSLLTALAQGTAEEEVAKRARGVLDELRERDARERTDLPLWSPRGRAGSSLRVVEVGPADSRVEAHPEPAATELRLRKVQAGEERALGELVQMDCVSSGVRFHVRVLEGEAPAERRRVVVAAAPKMEDVEITSFLETELAVKCGAHAPPERVYLTWRVQATNDAKPATAVALEFLPKTFVP